MCQPRHTFNRHCLAWQHGVTPAQPHRRRRNCCTISEFTQTIVGATRRYRLSMSELLQSSSIYGREFLDSFENQLCRQRFLALCHSFYFPDPVPVKVPQARPSRWASPFWFCYFGCSSRHIQRHQLCVSVSPRARVPGSQRSPADK